jgi:hypothetical protein
METRCWLVSQVIINRCKVLARFALMHCIASSLCFWIWTILRETLDSLNSYAKYDDYSAEEEDDDDDDRSQAADMFENSVALPLTVNQQSKWSSILNWLQSSFQHGYFTFILIHF